MPQYQLGYHPCDDASLQEDPHGGSERPDDDSWRLHPVELDYHLHLLLRALPD